MRFQFSVYTFQFVRSVFNLSASSSAISAWKQVSSRVSQRVTRRSLNELLDTTHSPLHFAFRHKSLNIKVYG